MPKKPSREAELESEIRVFVKLAKEAQNRGSYQAAVNALSKVSTLRNEVARLRDEREAEAIDDPLLRVQRLRRLATEAGSYTPAAHLSRLENDLLEAKARASQAAKGDGFENATDEEILAAVEAAIKSLPDTLVVRIREACNDRLTGPRGLRVIQGG